MLEDHSRRTNPARVEYVNRFAHSGQAGIACSYKHMDTLDSVNVNIDVSAISNKMKAFVRSSWGRECCVWL